MKLHGFDRREVTIGDVLVGLSVLALLAAFIYPTARARAFRGRVDTASFEIESLRSGAQSVFSRTGEWPIPGNPGDIPRGLSGAFRSDSSLVRADYTIQWTQWEIVEQEEAPPSVAQLPADADAPPDTVGPIFVPVVRSVGGIVVHSADRALLAELLARYGDAASFVRDTMWTLIVTDGD